MSSDQSIFQNRFVRMAFILLIPVAILGYLISEVGPVVYHQYTLEQEFQANFGDHWQEQYESAHGPLSEHRTKAAVGLGSMIVVCGLAFTIYRISAPPARSRKRRRKGRGGRERRSMPPARRSHLIPQ